VASFRSTDASAARIKGAAFREFLRFYVDTQGTAQLRARAAAVPAALRSALDLDAPVLGVVASSWYPAPLVHALLDELTRGMNEGETLELAAAGSRAVMSATLRGLYRVLFQWMATPERYARYAPKLWDLYYDTGNMQVLAQTDALGAVATVRDWAAHHPFICELNRGASVAIYSAMGCSRVECDRTACVTRGQPECRFDTRWHG
jgi:hypothetical protein